MSTNCEGGIADLSLAADRQGIHNDLRNSVNLFMLAGKIYSHCCSKGGKYIGFYAMPHTVRQYRYDPVFFLDVPVEEHVAAYPFAILVSLLAIDFYEEIPVQLNII